MLQYLPKFAIIGGSTPEQGKKVLQNASPTFRRALRTALRVVVNQGMHDELGSKDLVERVAANDDPEGNDALHQKVVEMHGSGLGSFFKNVVGSVGGAAMSLLG